MSPAVLVFAESTNDSQSIAHLAKVLDARLRAYDVVSRRDPVVHLKNTDLPKTRRNTAESISKVVRAESVRRRVIAVIAHQDADAVEPAHSPLAQTIEDELMTAGVPQPVAAVPAWELEAWLMLFPAALRQTRSCWRVVDLGDKATGYIQNAKEHLRRLLRPSGNTKCPDYVESDSVRVFSKVDMKASDVTNLLRRSASMDRFHDKLTKLKLS